MLADVMVVVMRSVPLFVKEIWPTRGELATKEYVALLGIGELMGFGCMRRRRG
jgi:hypothetical protein